VGGLARALAAAPADLEPCLGRIADPAAGGFVALNTAFINDGAYVRVDPGVCLDRPVHLVFAITGTDEVMTAPRILIVAGDNSRVAVIEHYVGLSGGAYLTNAVTEIVAGAGAHVEHCKIQLESTSAYHVATVQAHLDRGSRCVSRNFSLGARLARNDINAVLNGAGAECAMDGLFLAGGRQHVDNHTCIDHAVPDCTSRERYKGVLDGRARGVFNGRIVVRQDAQHTDAHQSNHNLLLSDDAEVDTKPQLEIFADDVRCSHGATVGNLDNDALFYLRSRGLDEPFARGLLTYAFMREVIDAVDAVPLRTALTDRVLVWLPGADQFAGAAL
jgi:Fe-S cluster assembly protein SufD